MAQRTTNPKDGPRWELESKFHPRGAALERTLSGVSAEFSRRFPATDGAVATWTPDDHFIVVRREGLPNDVEQITYRSKQPVGELGHLFLRRVATWVVP